LCESRVGVPLQDWNAQVLAASHAAEASPDADSRPSRVASGGAWAEEVGRGGDDLPPASYTAVSSAADAEEDGDVLLLLDELKVKQRTTRDAKYRSDQYKESSSSTIGFSRRQ
jgi:hypothetical protein